MAKFDFNKLSQREKTLVGGLVLIASTIPFFQYTLPTWNNYINANKKIKGDQIEATNVSRRIKSLERLKVENQRISKKLNAQKVYLAKSYEIDFLVQDLKNICDESLITLESFTPSNPEPVNIVLEKQVEEESHGESYTPGKFKQVLKKLEGQDLPVDLYRFPIEVKVTGNFTDILELFKKLENYGRVISVENISIGKIQSKQSFGGGGGRLSKSATKKKQEEDTGSLLSTFDLVAYSLPDETEKISVKQLGQTYTGKTSSFKFKKRR